jgi:glycosyltransferase involved in cell wall biosynthesis
MNSTKRPIVVLGMMAKIPVPGVIWQTLHYLVGLRRLGFDPYYVEAHARTPTMLMEHDGDDASARAAKLIDKVLRRFDFSDRWAFHALHGDGNVYGLSSAKLGRVLEGAELLLNLHGATEPREELAATGRLVYVETDPVQMQIELHDGVQAARDFLAPHCALFTFAECYGDPGCGLPMLDGYNFRPTRQPVVLDFWRDASTPGRAFRTVGNFHQPWRDVHYHGESFGWSKDTEWRKFLTLPAKTGQKFELALSGHQDRHAEELTRLGFKVREALDFGFDLGRYRSFITGARGEFTVAKDQNIRLRTGWFSDRSATFLAAGRAVVTQDTAFGAVLPTGKGLFAVNDVDEAAVAIDRIAAHPKRAGRAAAEIAREYFDAERVLSKLLADVGVGLKNKGKKEVTQSQGRNGTASTEAGSEEQPAATADTESAPSVEITTDRAPSRPAQELPHLHRESTVLALIPHFKCEEYLDDCLAALVAQTRPLDGIVVIDDASEEPPVELVRRYPNVTLMSAAENSGPYRLVQQVINDTDYDAYMFQDADDWSAPDRLERLLAHAEESGADMIGSQEVRVFCDEPEVAGIQWPLDGNAQFVGMPTAFPLLHPTTLVSRHAMVAAGGYSMGLRFGGDAEFLRRVHHVARCVNTPHYGYYRRIRQGSLTTAPATAIGTPARKQLMEETFERAHANAERVATGDAPDLTPLREGSRIKLTRLAGPRLHTRSSGERQARPAPQLRPASSDGPTGPVFVVGAERSGASALAAAIGQHPSIALSIHGGWLARLANDLDGIAVAALDEDPATFGVMPPAAGELAEVFGPAASAAIAPGARRWVDGSWQLSARVAQLAAMFPDARFVHVVRDVHSAVRALADPPLGSAGATGGTQVPARLRAKVSEPEAVRRWTDTTRACLEAQRELGSKRMLTVSYSDLVVDPEFTIRRCLDFLGERFASECLRPMRELRTLVSDAPLEPDVDPELWDDAISLDTAAFQEASSRRGRARRADGRAARVVMVTDHFPKFSETFFVRKFLGLLRRGWDVHVVCQRSNDEHWRFFPKLRDEIRHQNRLHVVTEGLDRCIVDLRPDIVHFGYGTLAYGRMHVREAAGCKVVTSFRGYDLNSFRLDEPGCFDEVFAGSDVIHAVSEAIWERAQERGCPPDGTHEVITDAVDAAWFEPPVRRDAAVGTRERPLRVLSVGRLHWKKGYDFALQAIGALVERGIEVEYKIVGEGEHREPIQFAITDLGLEQRVELVGAQSANEVRDRLSWADVFLHASITEAFGVAVTEAQAMGLPVVCSDAGGLPENVEHGVTGFVVGRRESAAMAQRLAELATDPALRSRMGQAARHRAETVLSAARQLDRFEDIYERLLDLPRTEGAGSAEVERGSEIADVTGDMRSELYQLDVRKRELELKLWRREVLEAVQAFVADAVPRGAQVLIVSHGDEEIVALPDRDGAHFPQSDEGLYAGHHPGDSGEAIRHLEQLRTRGAQYLIIPATSGWWLDHYEALAEHLDSEHTRLDQSGDLFVAFELTSSSKVAAP